MTSSPDKNFDDIMDKAEADVELALLKEKMEQIKERRREAVRKYLKKMRETSESYQEKEKLRARQRYADNIEKMREQKREYYLRNKDNIKRDPEKDKRYYLKLREKMEEDPELKERKLEQQRARNKIRYELVKANKIISEQQLENNEEVILELL